MDKNNAVAVSIANPYTYYDLLALLCYSIHELEQDVQNNLAMYASSHFSQYINEANELIQRLFPKSSSVISGYSSLNWNVFTLLSAMLDNRKDLHGWAVILGLISLIDTKLPIDKNFVTFLEGRNCKVLDDEHAGVSESYYEFKALKDLMKRVIKYAEVFSCDVIFCNTCAAWDDALEPPENRKENNSFDSEFVGFYHPAGHKNYEEAAMKKLPFADCKGSVCQGCLFVTKLAKKYNTQFVASQQIRLEEA